MQGVNVGIGDTGDLHSSDRRLDIDRNLLLIVALRRWPLARRVLLQKTVGEIGDGRRRPALMVFADRIGAAVDGALEPLGLVARSSDAPGRE
jgi:hypothetical protein